MTTIKSYTDIEQSKVLAKILTLESADMYFNIAPDEGYSIEVIQDSGFIYHQFENTEDFNDCQYLPCWSLAALLELLDYPQLSKDKLGSGKVGWMVSIYPDNCRYDSCWHDNSIDACYEMIIKLHELDLV